MGHRCQRPADGVRQLPATVPARAWPSRDPATGAKKLMGEYLINARARMSSPGVRTPSPISHLQDQMPEVYDEFVAIANRLEALL